MSTFLSHDSSFTNAVRHFMFFALVNIFWMLCCIPVVTIGMSTTAMFSCLNAYQMTGSPDSWKKFFPTIKQNWKQSLLMGIVVILGVLMVLLSAYSIYVTDIPGKMFFAVVVGIAAAGVGIVALYFFPLLAQFHNTTGEFVRISLIIGLRHFVSTIAIVLFWIVVIFLCASSLYLIPIWIFGGIAFAAWLINRLYHRIFVRYGAPEWERREKKSQD